MRAEHRFWIFCAAASVSAWASAQTPTQDVYRCGAGRNTTYTHVPCTPGTAVNTDDAPVPAQSKAEQRRVEHNRAVARSLRRLPGESVAQFENRRHRYGMLASDREECDRLDKRIPVERARLTEPDAERVRQAQEALDASNRRYSQLRC
jgi:hypothetical protein